MKQVIAVVGTQWGDEGKGKITNYLSQKADLVIRFQGGDNAGHTIKFNGQSFALHLIPSGIFNPEVINVIGNGVVINPETLVKELNYLSDHGFDCHNLVISDRAHIIFDYHLLLDLSSERLLGDQKIGTTNKGIGPTYTDKSARIGMRVGDFVSNTFKDKFEKSLTIKNEELRRRGYPTLDFDNCYRKYQSLADQMRPYVKDTITLINDSYDQGLKILFEGAQGTLLDIDFGTYPFVTSSNASAGGITSGSGLGPTKIGEIIGITKSYSTRVGSGVFPTEINDLIADDIREKAHEYGTTTGRPRRIGWLDGVILKYSARVNGLTGISLMLLDILSGIKTLKIATSYQLDGQQIDYVPARIEDFNRCLPNYLELPGWDQDLTNIRNYQDLPLNAQKYIEAIEEITKTPVVIISVGPDQQQTITRKNFWENNNAK